MKRKRYSREQRAWCRRYLAATGFDAMMDDFDSGNASFAECARKSVRWFEGWAIDALRDIEKYPGYEDPIGPDWVDPEPLV